MRPPKTFALGEGMPTMSNKARSSATVQGRALDLPPADFLALVLGLISRRISPSSNLRVVEDIREQGFCTGRGEWLGARGIVVKC